MRLSMMELFRPLAVLLFLFALFSRDSHAAVDPGESLDRIRGAATAVALSSSPAGAEASAAGLDARLRLAACGEPLAAMATSQTASGFNVEVRCASAGWKLNVPVAVKVQVPVLVASRSLDRGQVIGAGDVEVQSRDRATLGVAWASSPDEATGKVLTRPIPAGSIVPAGVLAPVKLVRRGQSVQLIGVSGGFQVRAEGKALADGAAGDMLSVENASSRRIVQGQVRPDGSVEIRL